MDTPITGIPYRHFVNDRGEGVVMQKSPIYYGFQPKILDLSDSRSVVIGHERIAYMADEIYPLHKKHWEETEVLYLDEKMLPDYTRYTELEARKQFVVFTVRHNDKMVGYLQYYVFRSLHVSDKYEAREDAFFLDEDFRGTGIARHVLMFAEDALKQLGCKYVGMSSKAPAGGPDIGGFLQRQGYKPVALFYSKQL